MRCRPGEMKYEAFVQRDQVSGQTNEHCLSGVHPGKDQWILTFHSLILHFVDGGMGNLISAIKVDFMAFLVISFK